MWTLSLAPALLAAASVLPGAFVNAAPLNNATMRLAKRFSDARFTWYDAGLGACGKTNKGTDFIVALNIEQWDGGSHCFEEITISYNGKSTSAQIVDQCPGCPFGALDLSESLFEFFASTSVGVLSGSWSFGSSGGSEPEPKTTTTHKPQPTTTAAPATTHKTTATPKPAPTTTSTEDEEPATKSEATKEITSSKPSPTSKTVSHIIHTSVPLPPSVPSSAPSVPSPIASSSASLSSVVSVTPTAATETSAVPVNVGADPASSTASSALGGIQGGIGNNDPTSGSTVLSMNKATYGLMVLSLLLLQAL